MRRGILTVWFAVVACGLCFAGPARAQVPDQVNVQGALRDGTGALLEGNLSVTIRIYSGQTGGAPLWQETQTVAVAGGLFAALVPGNPAANPFPATLWTSGQRRWLAIQPAGQAELPRTPLVSVPTALHARTAGTALSLDCAGCVRLAMLDPSVLDAALVFFDDATSGLGTDSVQGAIEQLSAAYDALLAGLAPVATTGRFSDLVGIPAGLANGDDDTLAGLTCTPGQVAKKTVTGWECAADIDTKLTEAQVDTYVSNNGYALASSLAQVATTGQFSHLLGVPAGLADGDQDTLGALACAAGQVAKRVGGGWQCADDIDTKLTEAQVDAYVSNNGYALSSSLAQVAATGQFSDLLGIPAGLADGDQDTLAGISCAVGMVLKRTVSGWDCGTDIDTKLTEAQVDAYVANNGYALASSLATVATSGQFSDLLGVPAGLADGDQDTLGALACANGQIAKRDGGVWKCGLDVDTTLSEAQVDAYVSNNGYARAADLATVATTGLFSSLLGIPAGLADGDQDTLGALACAVGQIPEKDATGWRCGTDDNLTEAQVDAYVSNNGYALASSLAQVATTGQFSHLLGIPAGLADGDQDTLGGLTCANGQVPKRSGSVWVCGDDALGGAGGGGEGTPYWVVFALRSNTYCPVGYEVATFSDLMGPNGWLYFNIHKQGLSLAGSNGNSYGQTGLWLQIASSEGISHVCWKRYTSTSGRPHVSVLQMSGGSAASCPSGYFYIPASHTKGNNGYGYSMAIGGAFYMGYVNSWWRDSHVYNDEDGTQSWWWTSHVDTICIRVYGVDEDPATANGVYPVFMGLQNLSSCPSGWNSAATSSLDRSDGYFYLMGNRQATFFGGMYDWTHAGGMGAHVYFHNTHVYNVCWKYFVRASSIQPSYTIRTPRSGSCPTGYYSMEMSHIKGWNATGYMQGTTGWLYLGGLYSWSAWDYEDGFMRQTWTDQAPNRVCLQMYDVL
jgi:hypothetical protein